MGEPIDYLKKELPIYGQDELRLLLTKKQKDEIRVITLGIIEVDENIRKKAVPDVLRTLENGHPLNRLITSPKGEIVGYIACEDWGPREAYIKYLGIRRNTGRDLFREIPAFLEYAREKGYTKLSFHGWNNKLNHILGRYGFNRIRDDELANFKIGFFEKDLTIQ